MSSKDKIYGISRNPNTEDYIIVFYNEYSREYFKECYIKYSEIVGHGEILTNWISGNEKIDNLIQEMQSKINVYGDILFEWIPYDQFGDIEEVGNGGFATVYSAKWNDGPLSYNNKKWIRDSDKKVALKCLNNSQNINNEFLNEVQYEIYLHYIHYVWYITIHIYFFLFRLKHIQFIISIILVKFLEFMEYLKTQLQKITL
jgi:hypothetical protein